MHVPDGFLDLPTSLATAAAAAAALTLAVRSLRLDDDRWPVRAGLTASFVFAAQLVNFPVGAGTSGHLVGAGLATALVGPAAAIVVMACVLVVQALVFADGGLTALGTNVLLIAVVAVLVAHGVQQGAVRLLRKRTDATAWSGAAGAFASVPAAALVFCGLYVVGGAIPVPASALTATMLGVHAVIGVVEAAITGLCLRTVSELRPDLVALGRTPLPGRRRAPLPAVGWGVLGATLLVAGGLSLAASAAPDGLEWSAQELGFAAAARDSLGEVLPFAGYALEGLGPLGASAAGVVGVGATLALVVGVASLVRRVRRGAV